MIYKNTEDYDPSLYACYAITSIKEDFAIYTVHPSGLREYGDYHIYEIEDKTLIAFTKIYTLRSEFTLRIISENNSEDINTETFEALDDILSGEYNKNIHTFILHNSVGLISKEDHGEWLGSAIDPKRRCDVIDDHYISMPFVDANKENASDILDRTYLGNDTVIGWQLVLPSMSNLYINKLTHGEMNDRAYKDWPGRVFMSQTFPHILKMAYQWAALANEPWNSNDTIALKCKAAFDDWDMPEDALQEIVSYQPSTVLEYYFNGDEDPRQSINEPSEIPPKFKQWFMSKIRYKTLYSLNNNYPLEIEIPSSMLNKENEFFQTIVSNFLLENVLDPDTTSCADILKVIYKSPGYEQLKHKNNSVDDVIIKYFSFLEKEERELVKEYLFSTTKPIDFSEENK